MSRKPMKIYIVCQKNCNFLCNSLPYTSPCSWWIRLVGLFFGDISDTSALRFASLRRRHHDSRDFAPVLSESRDKTYFFSSTNQRWEFINQYEIHIRRLLQWLTKHAEINAIFQSLTKSEQSKEWEKTYRPERSSISQRNRTNSDSAVTIGSSGFFWDFT